MHAAKANTWLHFYFTEKTERMKSNIKSMNLPDSSFREKQAVGYVDLRISFWYEDNNWKVLKKLSIDSVSHGAECEPTQGESERRQEGLRPRF